MRLFSVVASAIVAAACGHSPTVVSHLRAVDAPSQPPRAAREPFEPERFETVFEGAVRAVLARGYEIVSCDATSGVVNTARVEVDAPCGRSTCLAREFTSIKLGHRRVRVSVTREVWDATLRAWRAPEDPVSLANMEREERTLLERALRWPSGGDGSRLYEVCRTPECEARLSACIAANGQGELSALGAPEPVAPSLSEGDGAAQVVARR
jgi:hypothetical protein